jgi:hypothetical protein
MNDFQLVDERFTEAVWAALDAKAENDPQLRALIQFSETLNELQRDLYQDGRTALAEFDAHHNRADAVYRKCEKLQEGCALESGLRTGFHGRGGRERRLVHCRGGFEHCEQRVDYRRRRPNWRKHNRKLDRNRYHFWNFPAGADFNPWNVNTVNCS